MPETLRVTLARIEERQITMDDKMDEHFEAMQKKTDILDLDVGSLKQSRAMMKGVLVAISIVLSFFGIDYFQ